MDKRPDPIPDGIQPLVGYRLWAYVLGHGRAQLHPLSTRGDDWLHERSEWDGAGSNWVVAACRSASGGGHIAPDERCTCGFHAMASPSPLIEIAVVLGRGWDPTAAPPDIEFGIILGRIEMAGRIIEHELGYRAERARIAELIPIFGCERTVRRLAFRLGLRVGGAVVPPPTGSPPPPASPVRRRVREWVRLAAACLSQI